MDVIRHDHESMQFVTTPAPLAQLLYDELSDIRTPEPFWSCRRPVQEAVTLDKDAAGLTG